MEIRAWVGLSDSDGMYYERRIIVRLDEDDVKEFLRQLEAAQQSAQRTAEKASEHEPPAYDQS